MRAIKVWFRPLDSIILLMAAISIPEGSERSDIKHYMALAISAFGVLMALIWVVIGWRAMRAHEKLADHVARYLVDLAESELHDMRKEHASHYKQYKQFLLQHPDVEALSSKERHERFREWTKGAP